MNRKNKKCLPLRMAGAALALWAILMALMVFAQNQGGGLLILAFLLVLLADGGRYVRSALHGSSAAGPNAPWASARVRALRRRCSALCAAALCLVMLPVLASAAISGSLDVSGLAVSDSTNNGTAPSSGSGGAATSAGWTASGTGPYRCGDAGLHVGNIRRRMRRFFHNVLLLHQRFLDLDAHQQQRGRGNFVL